MRAYTELTHHALQYAQALPLEIKVSGLFSFG